MTAIEASQGAPVERAGQAVLVTGASKGIGAAIAIRLGALGYPVVVHYGRDEAGASATVDAIESAGGEARMLGFDVRDRAAIAATLGADIEAHGACWGIVLNAGITRDNAFPALAADDWDSVVRTNLDGFYNVLHPLIMPLVRRRDGGRIIAISSVAGLIGNRGQVNYSAAKAGLIGATKALAVELGKRRITVNCVAPGLIDTAMTEDLPLDEILAMIPLRRGRHRRRGGGHGCVPDVARGRIHHPSGDLGQRGPVLMHRVVVTGMAGLTSLGADWPTIKAAMQAGRTGIRHMTEWDRLEDLRTKLGGAIDDFDHTAVFSRKKGRSMGRVGVMAVHTAETALAQAGLLEDPRLHAGRAGVAYGSSYGSTPPTHDFVHFVNTGKATGLNATSYIRMMSHTTAVNIGVACRLTGRVITTSSACTSGSQGIGYAFEAIRYGKADIMIAGGGEELCPSMAVVFDTLFATSTSNDSPQTASRPFDRDRNGLVIGEGAATLVLENAELARARGATVLAEIIGFATNADGAHITQPAAGTQAIAQRLALEDAGITPQEVQFVSGHGTATDHGDVVEAQSTWRCSATGFRCIR